MRRIRRALGFALLLALIVVDLGLAAFAARDLWLEPLARREAVAALREALGVEVDIDAIRIASLRTVHVRGIDLPRTDPGFPLAVEGADVAVSLDPFRLADGDLAGLRGVQVDAQRIELRIPAGEGEATSGPKSDPWDVAATIARWLDPLPDGARVRVESFTLLAPDGTPIGQGPLRVTLSPRPRRRVAISWAGVLRAEVVVTSDGIFHADLEVEDLPTRVVALGIDLPVRSGTVRLAVDADAERRDLRSTVLWSGGALRERGGTGLAALVRIRGGALQFDLDADLPGGTVVARDVGVPLEDLGDLLHAARGSVAVEIRDLEPWRPLLPEPVLAQMPITGSVRATMDARGLSVRPSTLRTREVSIALRGGRLPLDGDVFAGRASLRAQLTAAEPVAIPVGDDAVRVQGRADVELSGDLRAPRVEAELDLGPGSAFGHSFGALRGHATLADGEIRLAGLSASDVRADAGEGSAELRGTVSVRLPTADDPATTLQTDLTVRGDPSGWLDEFAPGLGARRQLRGADLTVAGRVVFGTAAWPSGRAEVEIDALTFADGSDPARGTLRVQVAPPTDRPEPATLNQPTVEPADGPAQRAELTADLVVTPALAAWLAGPAGLPAPDADAPLRASVSGWLGPRGVVELSTLVHASNLRIGGAAPLQVDALLEMPDPDTVQVRQFTVCGPVDLDVRGTWPVGGADDRDVELRVHGAVADPAAIAAWLPGIPETGDARVTLTVTGPRGAPDADLAVRATAPAAALGRVWPDTLGPAPEGAIDLDVALRLHDGAVRVERLQLTSGAGAAAVTLTAAGTAPLRVGFDGVAPGRGTLHGDLEVTLAPRSGPLRLRTPFVWSEASLRLPRLALSTTVATVDGTVALLEPQTIAAGRPARELPLRGALEIRGIDLANLPPGIVPPEILGGVVDGVVALGGTAGAPDLSGTVALRGGRAKLAGDVPLLDAIRARIRFDPDAVVVEEFRAAAGVGSLTLTGRIDAAPGTSLLTEPAAATVALDVAARDALLVRSTGKKVRADAELTVRGDLARLDVDGEVRITSGSYVKRISLVPDLATRGGAAVGTGIDLFSIPPPLGDAVHFDVRIRTTEPFQVATHLFNAPLSASLVLRGTAASPYLDGAVSTNRGTLRLPALTLDVSQALVTFTQDDPGHPRLLLRSSTRRHGIDVSLTATGRIDAPEILMSSLPPLTQQELLVLVSTGVLPETLQEQGLTGRAAMVGGYLAEEILDFYFGSDSTEAGASVIDRFQFYSGREISRNGVESLVIDFEIGDGFALEGERDVFEDYNMGVLYRIRF